MSKLRTNVVHNNNGVAKKNTNFNILPKLVQNNKNSGIDCLILTDGSLITLPYTICSRTNSPNKLLGSYVSAKISRNDYLIYF